MTANVLRLTLAASAMLAQLGVPAAAQDHPGWPTTALIEKFEGLLGETTGEPRVYSELRRFIDLAEDPACFLREGERVTQIALADFSTAVLVGDEQLTHSVWFYFPIINVGDTEAAFDFYAAVFAYLVPGWDGAATWAGVSLQQAWDASGRAFIDPMITYDDMVARHAEGSIRLATYGVPPDIVFYRVTSRPECEVVTPFMLEKPRPVPHDGPRDITQQWGQLQLNDIYPKPVDVSATPIFLGVTHWRTVQEESLTRYRFDKLPGINVDFQDWIDRQVRNERFETTTAAIENDWGYTSRFLHLVTEPDLLIETNEGPRLLMIEKFSSSLTRSPYGHLNHEVNHAEATIFAMTMPRDDEALEEAPEMSFGGADMVWLEGRDPEPIDLSTMPMMLGRLHLYYGGHSGDRPGYYESSVDGMVLNVMDRATGETAPVDISEWAEAEGAMTGEPGGRVIGDPSLFFDLGGKQHRLVLQSITIDRSAKKIESLTGHLFAER